ncbi:MAG: hypothetical protein ABI969_20465, partial [bacterium]
MPEIVLMRFRFVVAACVSAFLLGCAASLTEAEDSSICQQTYEFGNYGCGDVEGRIVNPAGAPVQGVRVNVSGDASANGQSLSANGVTGNDGRYALRLTRYVLLSGTSRDSATVSVWTGVGARPALSTIVVAQFSDVGARAKVTSVPTITLT